MQGCESGILSQILGFLWIIPSHLIKYTCYHLDLIDLDPEQAGRDRWTEGGIQWHSRKKQACLSPKSTGVKSFALNYKWPGLRSQLRYLLCHSWQVTQPYFTLGPPTLSGCFLLLCASYPRYSLLITIAHTLYHLLCPSLQYEPSGARDFVSFSLLPPQHQEWHPAHGRCGGSSRFGGTWSFSYLGEEEPLRKKNTKLHI